MSWRIECDSGTKQIIRWTEKNCEVAMSAAAASGRNRTSVSEELTLQCLQRGVGRFADDRREGLVWKIEFRRGRHVENNGLSRHGQLEDTGSVDDYPELDGDRKGCRGGKVYVALLRWCLSFKR